MDDEPSWPGQGKAARRLPPTLPHLRALCRARGNAVARLLGRTAGKRPTPRARPRPPARMPASAASVRCDVGLTLELSCEAPIVPGFVSFNSLLGGAVDLRERSSIRRACPLVSHRDSLETVTAMGGAVRAGPA